MYHLSLITTYYDPETFAAVHVDHDEFRAETLDVVAFMATYRENGYFTRIGDGWGTAAKPEETVEVIWEKLTAAEVEALEAAEAAAEAKWDAHVNA